MKPDDHWFSQYFAQDHAGNFVDILINLLPEKRQPVKKPVIVKPKEESKSHVTD